MVVGDWSHDGHSQTATVTIKSNLDHKALTKAYKRGEKKTDVNFEAEVASNYEDNELPGEVVEKLEKHGFKLEDVIDPQTYDDEDGRVLWVDEYAEIWLFIAAVGNPSFKYEIMTNDSPNINIGGYGLFFS
jgi:hypothetical protein